MDNNNNNNNNNGNLLQTSFNCFWETGQTIFKLVNKLITGTDTFDFNSYFDNVRLYTQVNDKKVKPKLINKEINEEGEKYIFSIPPGYGKESLTKYKDGLTYALGYPIEFKFKGCYWEINVIKTKLKNNIPYNVPVRSDNGIVIPLGESVINIVLINLRDNPNTFIVGTTGSGKSVCVKSIITSLVNTYSHEELELYLCDLKRVELNLFANLKHTKQFVYKVDDVTQTIIDILEECEKRYDLFMKYNVTNIFEFNKIKRVEKIPYKILFIEEIVLLLQDKKNTGMKALKQLLSICRASGIYVFISTQRPSSDVLDNVVKANINNRICFKVEDTKNSVIALDDEGAEQLRGKGHGILKIGAKKIEFQGYNIGDEQCKELIEQFIKKEQPQVTIKQLGFKSELKEIKEVIEETNEIEDLSFLDKI